MPTALRFCWISSLVGCEHAALADVHRELERLTIFLQDAVRAGRPARFAEQRLGLVRMKAYLAFVRRVVVRLEGGHDRRVGRLAIALFDGRDDRLAVDRVLERLAHLDVLEARIGLVQRQPVVLDQLARLDAQLRRRS